jgi:hypothetical protein
MAGEGHRTLHTAVQVSAHLLHQPQVSLLYAVVARVHAEQETAVTTAVRVCFLQINSHPWLPAADLPAPAGQPGPAACAGPCCGQLQPGITQPARLPVKQQRGEPPAGA